MEQLREIVRRIVRENYNVSIIRYSESKPLILKGSQEGDKNNLTIKNVMEDIIQRNHITKLKIVIEIESELAEIRCVINGVPFSRVVNVANPTSKEILSSIISGENYTHDDLMKDLETLLSKLIPVMLPAQIVNLNALIISLVEPKQDLSKMREYVQKIETIISELQSIISEMDKRRETVISILKTESGIEYLFQQIREGKYSNLVEELVYLHH